MRTGERITRISAVLAVAVPSGRSATTSQEPSSTHLYPGEKKSELGEGRIAYDLSLKLGIFVDARTVGKYMKQSGRPQQPVGQRWSTFMQNHAKAIVACDFFTSVTTTFQILYVFIAIAIGSCRLLHCNVTDHPTAEWTWQQFRVRLDAIFSAEVDEALNGFGPKVLKTPVRTPMANAHCEPLIGTIRRECLDYLIPMNERHFRRIVRDSAAHYNRDRPHTALGPGFPEPNLAPIPAGGHPHRLPSGYRVASTQVLGGLHHECRLERNVA